MKKDTEEIKIVIIEDDQEKREELVEILRDLGFKLSNISRSKYAENGIELIEDLLPEVVLLDLKIPYNKESESEKIENSNKVIKAVERLNATRNQEESSTGILIISASIDDVGLRRNYKNFTEVVDFFDKDEIALNESKFKEDLLAKIHLTVERDFRHVCKIDIQEIRNLKLKKLESIHGELHKRVMINLLGQFERLNNRNVNTYQIVENIIGLSGKIVEDIINLVNNNESALLPIDDRDNRKTVREKLTHLTGRKWNYDNKSYDEIGKGIFSRKAAEFARFAYQLRSEALHTKEGDSKNKKLFVGTKYSIEDAAISINLITPILLEFITYMNKK